MRDFVKVWAAFLGIVGVLLLLGGAGCTVVGLTGRQPGGADYPPFGSEFYGDLRAMGLIALAIGAGHVVAGVGMWNQGTRGRWLGAALGAGGLILTAWVWYHEPAVPWMLSVPALAYGLTLAAAIVWYPDPPVGPRSP